MKKVLFVLFLLSVQIVFSQSKNEERISLSFNELTKLEVIGLIEEKTSFKFYFFKDWIDNKKVTGSYTNISLSALLDELFKDSVLNYYLTKDKRVILTSNGFIYDSLPKGFGEKTNLLKENISVKKPFFYNQKKRETLHETVRIGKASKISNNEFFILNGFVKNSNTGKPIPNLAILVLDKNINTITGNNGFYSINIPQGVNIIETKALGIESIKQKVIIYNNGRLNFNLKENSEILDEVLVRANQKRNVKEAITGITKFQVEEIKSIPLVLGERDILKVATTLPGIKTAGEGASGYSVRGGKEDQNLMLLDDAVLYNPSHFFGIFSALNPFTSGDVNIYKGNIPAEYGGRLSSVFEINTKKADTQNFSGEAAIGPVTSNLSLEIPLISDKSSLLVGGRGTYSDWILKSLDEKSINNSKASFYDIVAKYRHQINDKSTIESSGYYSKDSYSITSDSLYGYSNRLMSLKWNHQFNKKNSGSLILSNSEYKFDIDFESNNVNNFNLGYKINETGLKVKMKFLHNLKHKFDYGISSKLYIVNPGSKRPLGEKSIVKNQKIQQEKGLESSLFISDNYKVNEKLLLNVGLRYSTYSSIGKSSQRVYFKDLPKNEGTVQDTLNFGKNEVIKTYGGPEFRTSFRYFLTPSFSIKGSFNSSYQYIHSLSNNTTVSPTDTWKLSDLNIKPQQAKQYTLGFYKNFNSNIYELSIESYFKKSNEILDYKVGANLFLNEHIETEVLQGDGKAYGVEFLIKKTQGKFNGWLGYSYSRSLIKLDSKFNEELVNDGNYFSSNFDKPHDVSLVSNYKLTRRYSISANFVYQTGRPITYPIGKYVFKGEEYVLYSDRNKYRIPDYFRFDLGINIEGNHKLNKFAHSFWNISIYNLFGRNNPYSVYFVTENKEIKAYKSSIFSIPIPTISYNFKF